VKPTPAAPKEAYQVLVATYRSYEEAKALKNKLRPNICRPRSVRVTSGKKTYFVVKSGPFPGKKQADQAAQRLKTQERLAAAPKVVKLPAASSQNPSPQTTAMSSPVLLTYFSDLGPRHQGKVRDIYDLGDRLLLVATDRISAFDVVMADPIPDKGRILTQISAFWFGLLSDVVPNHLISLDVADFPPACQAHRQTLAGRTMLVRKTRPLPVECIVRGYLAGSGWADYQKTGAICGIPLPSGLKESDRLPEPIFTPSTKAQLGIHDENITFAEAAATIGQELAAGCGRSASPLSTGQRLGRTPGDHSGGHQVRVRARPGGAPAHRRGPHPGLLPLLATGRLRPRPGPEKL
jgi:hypothetical protein